MSQIVNPTNPINLDAAHSTLAVPAGGINLPNNVSISGTAAAGSSILNVLKVDGGNNLVLGENTNATVVKQFAYNRTAVAAGSFPAFVIGGAGLYGCADAVTRTITLVAAGQAGGLVIIKDEAGTAATHNIVISVASAGTIDNAASLTISTNFGVARLYWQASGVYFTC